MEQTEFLNKHVFKGLKGINQKGETDESSFFSEEDFAVVLERAEYFGIGIYSIETRLKGERFEQAKHEEHKKKATDPKWYSKAFLTLRKRQAGLSYSATYKVSSKLLAKEIKEE